MKECWGRGYLWTLRAHGSSRPLNLASNKPGRWTNSSTMKAFLCRKLLPSQTQQEAQGDPPSTVCHGKQSQEHAGADPHPPLLSLDSIRRGKMGKGRNHSEIISQFATCYFFSTCSLPRSSKCCWTDWAVEQLPVWGQDYMPGHHKKPTEKTKH